MPTAPAFEAPQGTPFHEVMLRAITESLAGNGVLANGDLAVSATATDLQIEVATGTYYYLATEYALGAAETHTLSAGDADYDRWDTVYFDTSTQSSGVREGTPEQYPTAPGIQGDEVLLAVVYVPSGATDVPDSDVLNWRAKFSNEAEETHYDDSTGTYSVSDVASALDELQEAAQITAYPLALTDLDSPYSLASITDMDVAGTDLVDAGTTLYSSSDGWFPNEVVQALANLSSDEQFSQHPIANSDIANSSVTVNVGTGLGTTNASIGLGGSATISISTGGVTTTEIADGTITDGDIDSATTISRGKLDDAKITASVAAATTTSGEEVVFVDTSGGAYTITLASSDATQGNQVVVKDTAGNAGTNAITVNTEGSESIDGGSSVSVGNNYGSVTLISDGNNWYTI